jgi:hypothetical protein
MFNHAHWNMLPIQMTFMIAVGAFLIYSSSAARCGNRQERNLFIGLAASMAAAQAIILVAARGLEPLPDTTEYQELFIAIGLTAFALQVRGLSKS